MNTELERARIFCRVLYRNTHTERELFVKHYMDYGLFDVIEQAYILYDTKYYRVNFFNHAVSLMRFEAMNLSSEKEMDYYLTVIGQHKNPPQTKSETAVELFLNYDSRMEMLLVNGIDKGLYYDAIMNCTILDYAAWTAAIVRSDRVSALDDPFMAYINQLFKDET